MKVGAGEPEAVKVCEYAVPLVPFGGAMLVNVGAAWRFRVKEAETLKSTEFPQSGVATPTDAPPVLITYELFVAVPCGEILNVASN
jgi:hypothetical protein